MEGACRLSKGAFAYGVEDDIVAVTALGKVLPRIVDDVISAERLHQFDVLGAAYSGDFCAQVFGKLYAVGADRAGRAVDQDGLARLQVGEFTQEVKGR